MDVSAPTPTTPAAAAAAAAAAPVIPAGPTLPTFRVEERISADFLGSSLTRVRLSGTVFLTLPLPKGAAASGDAMGGGGLLGGGGGAIGGGKMGGAGARGGGAGADAEKDGSVPDEFSFRLEGSGAIKRCSIRPGIVNDLGKGYFHFRTPPPGTTFPHSPPPPRLQPPPGPPMADLLGEGDEGMGEVVNPGEEGAWGQGGEGADGRPQEFVLMKYRLQPRYTPIPLRLRFVTRRSDEALSLMIQYVANPYLQAPLVNVTFVLSLAFSPASLRINPEAQLDPWTKELRWLIPQINPQDPPQRLRAQIPVIPDDLVQGAAERTAEEKQAEEDRKAREMAAYRVRVEFECRGSSLSGVTVGEVMATGKPPFAVAGHSFSSSEYICS
ncbi:hypothetical protein CLOM_g9143 [Closterium sp. NIES-68]|nr:hypothetical protein CLOM_g9143 [Closterium sp. NIES-68]